MPSLPTPRLKPVSVQMSSSPRNTPRPDQSRPFSSSLRRRKPAMAPVKGGGRIRPRASTESRDSKSATRRGRPDSACPPHRLPSPATSRAHARASPAALAPLSPAFLGPSAPGCGSEWGAERTTEEGERAWHGTREGEDACGPLPAPPPLLLLGLGVEPRREVRSDKSLGGGGVPGLVRGWGGRSCPQEVGLSGNKARVLSGPTSGGGQAEAPPCRKGRSSSHDVPLRHVPLFPNKGSCSAASPCFFSPSLLLTLSFFLKIYFASLPRFFSPSPPPLHVCECVPGVYHSNRLWDARREATVGEGWEKSCRDKVLISWGHHSGERMMAGRPL